MSHDPTLGLNNGNLISCHCSGGGMQPIIQAGCLKTYVNQGISWVIL